MTARIFQPAKTAMQSGQAGTRNWVLEYENSAPREIDPLMGWTSSRDTQTQVRLTFPSKDAAIAYAKRNGIACRVQDPKPRKAVRKTYADNFKFGRIGVWTH